MRIINVTPKMDALLLGKQGENKSTKFLFDVSGWLQEYPGCTITLVHRRPHESSSYPCVLTTEEDGRRSWVINSADLAKDGDGQAELKCTLGDVIEKDKRTWKTKIGKSLSGDGDAPEPWESLMEDIEALVGDAQDAAEDAEDAKDDAVTAKGAAEDAQTAAETAQGKAEDAQEAAETAQGKAEDAQEAAETAQEAAEAAAATAGSKANRAAIAKEYADLTYPVTKGTWCWHENVLYEANQAISTSETWTAAHWTAVTVEGACGSLLTEINSGVIEENLLRSELPGTTVAVTFDSNDNPSTITHSKNNVTIRTDVFTWGTDSVTEVRTLATGKKITIVTNLVTLAQTISDVEEVA